MRPVQRLTEIAKDDASVKLIFDHIRNLGLCAIVSGAAAFLIRNPDRIDLTWWIALALGSILYLVSLLLVILNAMHALLKATSLKSRTEQALLYLTINAIGPVTMIALVVVGPFRP